MALNEFINGFREGQKLFGKTISAIINPLLLFLVYILGVGITFLFAKIFRKHFLGLQLDKEAKTYWSDLNLTKKPMEEYLRQF